MCDRMTAGHQLVDRFELERPRLQAVATRILGSPIEAEDAVQEAWFRLDRTKSGDIDNLGAWLTVVVSHISLDHVRARTRRREDPLDTAAAVARPSGNSIDSTLISEESVYEALSHALTRLSPLETIAFIFHDLFQVPFDEIAAIIQRTPVATRKLASRARAKVVAEGSTEGGHIGAHREVVDAFMTAARTGDLSRLLSLLAPGAVLRADTAAMKMGVQAELRGAAEIAEFFDGKAQVARIAWFDGAPGAVWAPAQKIRVAFSFRIRDDGSIEEILLRSDPAWLESTDIEIEPRPRRKDARGGSPLAS